MAANYSAYDELAPHPYLREPKLYVSGLSSDITKEHLGDLFRYCTPFRPMLQFDVDGRFLPGTSLLLVLQLLQPTEKALATLQNRPLPADAPTCNIVLSPFPPSTPPTSLPPPSALPRLVKQLPAGITDSELYDLFRPFGPLANVRSEAGFGPDIGVVEFWSEDDARRAEEAMHCAEVGDQNISIQVYQPRRAPGAHTDFSANAPPFVPASLMYQQQQPTPPQNVSQPSHFFPPHFAIPPPYSPQNGSPPFPRSPPSANGSFVHGPGQQVQYAPPFGPGSGSHSGLIDPCNLFIKNLDPAIDSNELFTSFRRFGHIVSARVMRTETGQSRGFGFVSYQTPDQASGALSAMNGTTLGTKAIIVRLHEPKQLRQEKLATRYSAGGRNPHPRSASGATSPSPSDPGEVQSPMERVRRSSGSYYQAALAGTLGLGYQHEELSALSPVVRRDVLTGELTRQVKSLETVPSNEMAGIVESLVSLSLADVVEAIHNQEILKEQVESARSAAQPAPLAPGETTLASPAPAAPKPVSVSTVPTAAPTTPAKSTQGLGSAIMSPQTSAISLSGASAAATPEVPGTPAIASAIVPAIAPATVHTLASLARLPATEIIKLANSPNATGLPLAKADPDVVKATDEFIDNLNGQSEQQKKQVVGTKLFKAVKAFGIRNAKITIHLLDTEDLRALTHLMNSYPSVLKEKVQQAAAATAAK
ncbi:hypothetical protein M407DRAFT_78768 [Tulasnella calospora MUT 4182]|uniref:RRM domain-containing protein n=1 Tax=Tulasnella calospora MUT 4182 TaxID=1051891 RepID=A0A0C3KNH2_9AGAM|nr:hypothetical protein M407DRAFT_78768 [Tulasnella calospora MUT 4182]